MKGELEAKKKEYAGHVTSETILTLREPEPYMCGDISEVVVMASRIMEHARNIKNSTSDSSDAREIFSIAYDIEHKMEDIRHRVEGLREWGEDWKRLAKDMIEKDSIKLEEIL